jgi:hypothetical protein
MYNHLLTIQDIHALGGILHETTIKAVVLVSGEG